jgi:hypothetical protein
MWLIQQRGDTVESWVNPESISQGIRSPDRPRPAMVVGRISGVDVAMDDASSHYRLRYDTLSGHLRGTLNGRSFWAVPQDVVRREGCIPPP